MAKTSSWKTIYSHHISYDSNNKPTTVTSTNTETWASRTYSAWWGWGSSSTWGSAKTDYATKYANNKAYQNLVSRYWADNVHSALDYMTSWNNVNKSTLNSLLSNKAWTSGSLGWSSASDSYTEASISNYNNAINHLKSQGMSDADAKSAASGLLEKSTLKNKSQEDLAWEMSPLGYEDGTDTDEYSDILDEYYDPNEDVLWDYIDNINDNVNDFINSYDKEETTTETKATTEHDPIFDYNTYFQDNIVGDTAKVWETWMQEKQPEVSNALTDTAKEYDEVTQSLQNLGFLEPNGEASATMPDTEEQVTPKLYDNADSIINDFNSEMEWEDVNWTWLTPQAAVQKYADFKWQLKKLRDNNWITDEEYAMYLKQLQENQTLRDVLARNKK